MKTQSVVPISLCTVTVVDEHAGHPWALQLVVNGKVFQKWARATGQTEPEQVPLDVDLGAFGDRVVTYDATAVLSQWFAWAFGHGPGVQNNVNVGTGSVDDNHDLVIVRDADGNAVRYTRVRRGEPVPVGAAESSEAAVPTG